MNTSDTTTSDATEQTVEILLESAARLIERALIKLDMRHHQCGECGAKRFRNRTQARVYEQFTDTPERLRRASAVIAAEAKTSPNKDERFSRRVRIHQQIR